MHSLQPRVAIVGCGFTGAAAAVALLDRLPTSFRLTLIEPDGQLGRGLAYGKADPFHLLNVRAANLSIRADRPGDFASWAADHGPPIEAGQHVANAFLPRLLFGTYVESRLAESRATRRDVTVEHRRAEAIRLDRASTSSYCLQLTDRSCIEADVVILAVGYGLPLASGRFGARPFRQLDPQQVAGARTALFVGTGLTFVDQWMKVTRQGFRGTACAISRRGLLPARHTSPVNACESPLTSRAPLSTQMSILRRVIGEREQRGIAPGDLVAAMRGQLQSLWQELALSEQSGFLRHVRPYWDRLRHRLPPVHYAELVSGRAAGILTVGPRRSLPGYPVGILRGKTPPTAKLPSADLVFDCSGHRPATATPLVHSLIRSELCCLDAHALGLSVLADGSVVDPRGQVTPGLFALGPLGQGSLYEITAVKEIAAQCALAATIIAGRVAGFPSAAPGRWLADEVGSGRSALRI